MELEARLEEVQAQPTSKSPGFQAAGKSLKLKVVKANKKIGLHCLRP